MEELSPKIKIAEIIARWRAERLRYDAYLGDADAVDVLTLDLFSFVQMCGFTENELSYELGDNPRTWVESLYAELTRSED